MRLYFNIEKLVSRNRSGYKFQGIRDQKKKKSRLHAQYAAVVGSVPASPASSQQRSLAPRRVCSGLQHQGKKKSRCNRCSHELMKQRYVSNLFRSDFKGREKKSTHRTRSWTTRSGFRTRKKVLARQDSEEKKIRIIQAGQHYYACKSIKPQGRKAA